MKNVKYIGKKTLQEWGSKLLEALPTFLLSFQLWHSPGGSAERKTMRRKINELRRQKLIPLASPNPVWAAPWNGCMVVPSLMERPSFCTARTSPNVEGIGGSTPEEYAEAAENSWWVIGGDGWQPKLSSPEQWARQSHLRGRCQQRPCQFSLVNLREDWRSFEICDLSLDSGA